MFFGIITTVWTHTQIYCKPIQFTNQNTIINKNGKITKSYDTMLQVFNYNYYNTVFWFITNNNKSIPQCTSCYIIILLIDSLTFISNKNKQLLTETKINHTSREVEEERAEVVATLCAQITTIVCLYISVYSMVVGE